MAQRTRKYVVTIIFILVLLAVTYVVQASKFSPGSFFGEVGGKNPGSASSPASSSSSRYQSRYAPSSYSFPGSDSSNSSSSSSKKPPRCGDGELHLATEECDDGNSSNEDGCSNQCKWENCGDGIVQAGLQEECDDGNRMSNDGCSDRCKIDEKCELCSTSDEDDDGDGKTGCSDEDCQCDCFDDEEAIKDYISHHCPDVFTPTNKNIPFPFVEYTDLAEDRCADYDSRTQTIRMKIPLCLNECADPCTVGAHEMSHHMQRFTGVDDSWLIDSCENIEWHIAIYNGGVDKCLEDQDQMNANNCPIAPDINLGCKHPLANMKKYCEMYVKDCEPSATVETHCEDKGIDLPPRSLWPTG